MARSLWSGTIAFGLVNIPVKLFTAVQDKSISFHLMSKDGSCRLRRKLYCPETGKEYDFSDTARGYEISPNQYVILEESEIKSLQPEKGETLDIEQFAEADEIDPIYFERTYFLGPGKGGDRAYSLLHDILVESKKVALGSFIMRKHEYLAVLRPYKGSICLQTLHYAKEIVDIKNVASAKEMPSTQPKAKKIALQLVEDMTEKFKPQKFVSDYQENLMDLITKKAEGEHIKIAKTSASHPKVVDLMDALEKSVKARQKARA